MGAMARPAGDSTPATRALTAAGIAFVTRAYDHDPGTVAFGAEAAQQLGVGAGRVFKTLVVRHGEGSADLAVGIVAVSGKLDTKAMARELRVKRVALADPALAERVTGYQVGGISPIGQKRRLPTLLDLSALEHPTVLVSGGRRGFDVELTPHDLLTATGGRAAAIAG